MINIAVLGYGTVGSGVVEVIRTNHELINKRAGEEIKIKYVLDLREFPGDPVEEILVHDFEQIVNDPEVKIVVEVMGGTGAAYTFTKRALEAGKSVCTSNKALVAKYGPELMKIAKEKKINFLFEASCGGGIPIIRAINGSLTADEIDEVSGILNGTTNYMLDKMITEGADFNTVLKEAQEKGYAEADPTADVEGQDACRKIAILSSLAYRRNYKDHTRGYGIRKRNGEKYQASWHKQEIGRRFLLRTCSTFPCRTGESSLWRKGSVQQYFCTWKHAWRCHVLWKRSRQASYCKCSCSRRCGGCKASS